MRALLLLLLAGCSVSHRFAIADLETLTVGESRRDDVLRRLGEPDEPDVWRSTERIVTPPTPLAWITWPVYWSSRGHTLSWTGRFDGQGVLREASLRIDGGSRAFLLIFIQPHSLLPRLDVDQVRRLRALEAKGVKVDVGGYGRVQGLDALER